MALVEHEGAKITTSENSLYNSRTQMDNAKQRYDAAKSAYDTAKALIIGFDQATFDKYKALASLAEAMDRQLTQYKAQADSAKKEAEKIKTDFSGLDTWDVDKTANADKNIAEADKVLAL